MHPWVGLTLATPDASESQTDIQQNLRHARGKSKAVKPMSSKVVVTTLLTCTAWVEPQVSGTITTIVHPPPPAASI